MYGRWFLFVFGFAAVILLIIGLIAAAWAPIFAVGIALLVAMAIIWGRASRRTSQVGSEHAAARADRREAGQPARPSASASPASGEGGAAEAGRTRPSGSGI